MDPRTRRGRARDRRGTRGRVSARRSARTPPRRTSDPAVGEAGTAIERPARLGGEAALERGLVPAQLGVRYLTGVRYRRLRPGPRLEGA